MMRKQNYENIYRENVRLQRAELKCFIDNCTSDADDLICLYKCDKIDMPDDEYRSAAFFLNKEYEKKALALLQLYELQKKLYEELPPTTRENCLDKLRFKFKVFSQALDDGGF
jgi:hypothetical protein